MNLDPASTPEGAEQAALYDRLAVTAAALRTHPDDAELSRLATWLGGMLTDAESIAAARSVLRRRSLETVAHVRVADALLDHALGAFARALLAEVKDDRTNVLYLRFFPVPHEDVIDLGLDAEMPAASHIAMALKQDDSLPAALRAHEPTVGAAVALGHRALAARADALADLGRHEARVEAWTESASAMHASVARTLGRIAEQRKLSPRWVKAFV